MTLIANDIAAPVSAELVDASVAIGRISDRSEWYTTCLANRIAATGKRVADMTVKELIALEIALDAELRAELRQKRLA